MQRATSGGAGLDSAITDYASFEAHDVYFIILRKDHVRKTASGASLPNARDGAGRSTTLTAADWLDPSGPSELRQLYGGNGRDLSVPLWPKSTLMLRQVAGAMGGDSRHVWRLYQSALRFRQHLPRDAPP
jgi:hypothetical protein